MCSLGKPRLSAPANLHSSLSRQEGHLLGPRCCTHTPRMSWEACTRRQTQLHKWHTLTSRRPSQRKADWHAHTLFRADSLAEDRCTHEGKPWYIHKGRLNTSQARGRQSPRFFSRVRGLAEGTWDTMDLARILIQFQALLKEPTSARPMFCFWLSGSLVGT